MSHLRHWALIATLLMPLGVAAWRVFPITDDAWSALYIKENGTGHIASTLHRTLLARIADLLFANPDIARATGVLATLAAWLAYAWLTSLLWTRLFPEARRWAPLAGALVLTPAVATTHLMTWMLLIPVQAPALLSMPLILLALDDDFALASRWWWRWLAGCVALVLSYCVSEYTVASTVLALATLGWRAVSSKERRVSASRAAVALMAASALGWAIFHFAFSRPDLRPDAGLGSSVAQWLSDPLEGLAVVPTRLWWILAGAYAQEIGTWKLLWGEKSTIAASLFGLLGAGLAAWSLQRSRAEEKLIIGQSGRVALLAVLCLIALLPEIVRQSLMSFGHGARPEDLATRFLVQALPFGACSSLALLRAASRPGWHYAIAAFVGFLAGHTVFQHSYARMRAESIPVRLGEALRSYVETSEGPVLAITPEYYGREYEIVYKATRAWPRELTAKLWVMHEGRAYYYFHGDISRSGPCLVRQPAAIDSQGLRRSGVWSRVLWLAPRDHSRVFDIEDYCVPPAVP